MWLPAALSACWICIKHLWCKGCPTDLIIVAAGSSTMLRLFVKLKQSQTCFLLFALPSFFTFSFLTCRVYSFSRINADACFPLWQYGKKMYNSQSLWRQVEREDSKNFSFDHFFYKDQYFTIYFFNKRSKFPTDSFETYHVTAVSLFGLVQRKFQEILTLEKNSSWTVLNCLPYIPPLPAGRYLLFAFAFDLQPLVRAEVTTNAAAKRDWPICQARPRSHFTIIREDAWDLLFLILGDDYSQQPRRIGQSVRLSQYQILLHVFLHNTSETDVSF